MKTILKSSIFENNILVKTFNKDFKNTRFKDRHLTINNSIERGTYREIKLDGVLLGIRDLKTSDHEIIVTHDFPFFKLQFEIEGSSLYTPFNDAETSVYIPGGHYNLFYLPRVNGTLTYKTNYRKTVEILFTENHIKKIIGDDFKESLQAFGEAIDQKKSFLMWNNSRPISSELLKSIQGIIDCDYPENLKGAFLATKVNELLVVLLAKTNEKNYQEENIDLSTEEYQNILKIEKFIQNNLSKTLSISELAVIAGVNASKLKQDFKVVFATTVFKYITKLRMELAKKLILDDRFTVAETSYKVGYKYPQHFTVAFKKLYGFLPSKLVKN